MLHVLTFRPGAPVSNDKALIGSYMFLGFLRQDSGAPGSHVKSKTLVLQVITWRHLCFRFLLEEASSPVTNMSTLVLNFSLQEHCCSWSQDSQPKDDRCSYFQLEVNCVLNGSWFQPEDTGAPGASARAGSAGTGSPRRAGPWRLPPSPAGSPP